MQSILLTTPSNQNFQSEVAVGEVAVGEVAVGEVAVGEVAVGEVGAQDAILSRVRFGRKFSEF